MGVNKVDLSTGETLIDISKDTVTPQTLVKGYTSHNSSGEPIVGILVPEGGSGGGIIDVTELPTENIDENAVYRVTETIQTSATNCYIISDSVTYSMTEFLESMGVPTVPNFYEVDELTDDIKGSDIETFSELHFYVLRTDGNCYIHIPEYGMTMTIGSIFFQDPAYDKGSTENIYAETEDGIYTTLETFKDVVRYFIRENGEWKEITAYVNVLKNGVSYPDLVSGDITTRYFGAVDIISGEGTELKEEWFLKRNGVYVDVIGESYFYGRGFEKIAIPHFIKLVGHNAFSHCRSLEIVTFKGTPEFVAGSAFYICENLATINVPWSEGEVAGAPWSATNATINYNYTEG